MTSTLIAVRRRLADWFTQRRVAGLLGAGLLLSLVLWMPLVFELADREGHSGALRSSQLVVGLIAAASSVVTVALLGYFAALGRWWPATPRVVIALGVALAVWAFLWRLFVVSFLEAIVEFVVAGLIGLAVVLVVWAVARFTPGGRS